MNDTTMPDPERERCWKLRTLLHDAMCRVLNGIRSEFGPDRIKLWIESNNPHDMGRFYILADRGGVFDDNNLAYASVEEQMICESELDAFEDLLQLLPKLIIERRKRMAQYGDDHWEAWRSPTRMKHVVKVGHVTIGTNCDDVDLFGCADLLRANQERR
jgi:hypothetical protein